MTRVLIVDDDALLQDILAERLSLRNYEVFIATNGQEAVDAARLINPDVILMDMQLPILTGWEATKLLKAAPETRSIAVIALTAHAPLNDRQKSLDAGCDDFESKPINFDRLIRKIEGFVARQNFTE